MSTESTTIHKALLKVENVFQKSGRKKINSTAEETDVYVTFILENTDLLGQISRIYQSSDNAAKALLIDDAATNRFLKILSRVANGNEGVSRQERLFVYQFWSAFQKI